MRILLIAARPGPDTMERHVISALTAMGHDVRHIDILRVTGIDVRFDRAAAAALRLVIREPERLHERALLRAATTFAPALVIALLGSGLSPKTVAQLRRALACPLVCWCQDALTNFGRQYLIGAAYDHVFVKDHYIARVLTDMAGLPSVHYLPEACNPDVHRPVTLTTDELERYRADIVTFGTLYYYRQAVLDALAGYDLKVWGSVPDWLVNRIGARHAGRSIYELEKCKVLAAAKISLNTLHFGEIEGLNCRAFETAACGGFQMMSYSPMAHEHFAPNEEIVMFENRQELREKVDYYLAHDEERARIATAGRVRAHRDHTYVQRLTELISIACGAGVSAATEQGAT